MLTITTDPALSSTERQALYVATVAKLHRYATRLVNEALTDAGPGEFSTDTTRALVIDQALQPLGGGRFRVNADLYRGALGDEPDADAGLVVIGWDDPAEYQVPTDVVDVEGVTTPATPDVGGAVEGEVTEGGPDLNGPESAEGAESGNGAGEGQEPSTAAPGGQGEAVSATPVEFDPEGFANVEALREFAKANDLNLHGASTRADVEQAIRDGLAAKAETATE